MLKNVLREARERRRLKQSDMAKIIGVTTQTYLKWENGIYEPKASQVKKLAEILEITEIEICRGHIFKDPDKFNLIDFIKEFEYKSNFLADIEIKEIIYKNIYDIEKFMSDLESKRNNKIERMKKQNIKWITNNSENGERADIEMEDLERLLRESDNPIQNDE
ncbi:helix-turn-helix transcriptional regulator [Salmonella enterica]|nr:helix-turn-helix transcriptional regulator [Salmonella enterica]